MKKTILFIGGDTQTGTTMISFAAAEELARDGYMVLYISAGFCPVNSFLPKSLTSASEELLAALMAENLTGQEVQKTAAEHRRVDILTGARKGPGGPYFSPDDLMQICTAAEKLWDWILIDGGCVLLEEGIQRALLPNIRICFVLTQQEKTVNRFTRWVSVQNLPQKNQVFILNKFTDAAAFYSLKEMAEVLECSQNELITIPYVPYGWQAEAERTTLLNFRRFRKAVRILTEWIRKEKQDG